MGKKKIGIITIYNINNYGSSLQAFALQSYLNNKGYETYVIDRKEKNALMSFLYKVGRKLKTSVKILKNFEYYNTQKRLFRSEYIKELSHEVVERFSIFNRTKLNMFTCSTQELKKFAKDDATIRVICGSDQIWSPVSIFVSPAAFLQFAPQEKRLAYAPSFGVSVIPDVNKKEFRRYISEIPYISVRENTGRDIIENLLGIRVPVVCDPTFLLNQKEWVEISETEKINDLSEYILLYFLEEPSESAIAFVHELKKVTNTSVIAVYRQHAKFSHITDEYIIAGPLEFVKLIHSAKYIVTDSFHGVALSINLNKNFWAFERNYHSKSLSQSSRIVSLLDLLGIQERLVHSSDMRAEISQIDYSYVNPKLEKMRRASKEYLDLSLHAE